MKDKKIKNAIKQAQDAVDKANKALSDVMRELDDDELDAVAGGDDPYADRPRVPTQEIDDELRERS